MAECSVCKKETSRYIIRLPEGGEPVTVCSKCDRDPAGYQPFKQYWDANIAERPVLVESDRHRERLMKASGLQVRPREHIDDLNHRRWTKGMPPVEK